MPPSGVTVPKQLYCGACRRPLPPEAESGCPTCVIRMFRILPAPHDLAGWKALRELQNELAARLTPTIPPAVDPKPLAWAQAEEEARRTS